MALFERVHPPSFAGATEWLNSEPLGPAELRGRVVSFEHDIDGVRRAIEERAIDDPVAVDHDYEV